MKCSILTFYNAHNYGASLQVFALKHYLEELNHEVYIDEFSPEIVKNIYSLNPFRYPFTFKSFLKRLIYDHIKVKQYILFESFIKNELIRKEQGQNHNRFDLCICGSDQIWNNALTGNIENYYLSTAPDSAKKVSYAASFGTKELTQFQKDCVAKHLPQFSGISLREEDGRNEIKQITGIDAEIVLDPVFLLASEKWKEFAKKAKTRKQEKFVLFYALRNDPKLIEGAEEIAEELKCHLYVIHPIGTKQRINGTQLYDVGPYEFVQLIQNAECICTNSFHASAFSIILKKKYFHIKDDSKETRVESMLSRFACYQTCSSFISSYPILDFEMIDDSIIEENRIKSMQFLDRYI